MKDKVLTPIFEFTGDSVLIDNILYKEGTSYNFSKPVTITVKKGDASQVYKLFVHSFTGLPVLWIDTDNRTEITNREDYIDAHFKLVEDVITRGAGDIVESDVKIKGRGNTTWFQPKKPYRLKFDNKISLLGESADKSWVLLANYLDKTLLRNTVVFYLGSISNIDYTPKSHFVELMINGQYYGNYQLTEKIKVSKNRLNIGDDGFLIEVDYYARTEADAVSFWTDNIGNPLSIKEPDISYNDENFDFVKSYILKAEEVLFSDYFTDPGMGWQKYLDIDTFVDWYLICEIAKNADSRFVSSCYMNLKKGGKLKMGPLWDFDCSMKNASYYPWANTTGGLMLTDVKWFARLLEDPVFVHKLKERFDYYYSQKSIILNEINEKTQYLKYSAIENSNRWNIFYNVTEGNYDIWGSYYNEVQSLKIWLNERFEKLKVEINKL